MTKPNNRNIYIFALSIILIILPIYFGFPKFEDGLFFYYDHGRITYTSKTVYILAVAAQVACLLGIIIFVTSSWVIQKQFGYKPTSIPLLVDYSFLKTIFNRIKSDFCLLLIFILDLFVFVFGVIFGGPWAHP